MPRKTSAASPPPAAASPRFNEAAARCRGKRPRKRTGRPVEFHASMRPRPDAAENITTAALIARLSRFNEAAARCRGKPGREGAGRDPDSASMRPRPDAAENADAACADAATARASMRPRPDAAENRSQSSLWPRPRERLQ